MRAAACGSDTGRAAKRDVVIGSEEWVECPGDGAGVQAALQ
jgi:hypothetical protein